MRTAKPQPRNEALDLIARQAAFGQRVLELVKESGLARPPKCKTRKTIARVQAQPKAKHTRAVTKKEVRRAPTRRPVPTIEQDVL